MAMTAGAWEDTIEQFPAADTAVDTFLDIVELSLRRGVSCIAEYVFRSHRPGDLDRVRAAGDAVVIITRCSDPAPRLIERNMADRLIAQPAVLRAAGASSVADHTAAMVDRMRAVELKMMTRFPVPTLTVDTTDQYDPGLDAIFEFAVR